MDYGYDNEREGKYSRRHSPYAPLIGFSLWRNSADIRIKEPALLAGPDDPLKRYKRLFRWRETTTSARREVHFFGEYERVQLRGRIHKQMVSHLHIKGLMYRYRVRASPLHISPYYCCDLGSEGTPRHGASRMRDVTYACSDNQLTASLESRDTTTRYNRCGQRCRGTSRTIGESIKPFFIFIRRIGQDYIASILDVTPA